ncbi:hypothetical protein GJ496_007928 [Pomphorhynchus laevis]|nr:hypothetical protein GJ496_007928 [Pomphorhynchus laevis]
MNFTKKLTRNFQKTSMTNTLYKHSDMASVGNTDKYHEAEILKDAEKQHWKLRHERNGNIQCPIPMKEWEDHFDKILKISRDDIITKDIE